MDRQGAGGEATCYKAAVEAKLYNYFIQIVLSSFFLYKLFVFYAPLICDFLLCCRYLSLKYQFPLRWGSYSILFCSIEVTWLAGGLDRTDLIPFFLFWSVSKETVAVKFSLSNMGCFPPRHHIDALVAMAFVALNDSSIDALWRGNGSRPRYPAFVWFCLTNVAISYDLGKAGPRHWTTA